MSTTRHRALFIIGAVTLAALLACAVGPRPAPLPEHTVECQFVPPDHVAETCLHGLGSSLLELPDTTLFYEKDSILRINTPAGFEPYHAHLFHKVGEVHRMEQVVGPADKATGVLTIDLSQFPHPETLIVASADHRATPTAVASQESAALGAAILPPYALAFKLAPKAQAATLLSLQPFRYELESPHGNLHLLVTPANRGDMLLSLIDLDQKLSRAFKDAYFHFRPADAALAPRLTVEVATKEGKTWQRAGTWPIPPGALASTKGAEGADALLFALRTFRKDLIPSGPPAELALVYPKEAPEVTATVTGRMAGTREKAEYRLVVSHAVPDDRAAKSYAFKTQAVTLTHDKPEQSLSVDLSSVDGGRFPVTSVIAHRLVTTWTTKGGMYALVPPLGRTVLASDPFENGPSAPAHIICASSAAYYDLVNFRGDGGAAKLRLMRQLGPSGGTSPNTTPTDAGPNGGGWTDGSWNPGFDSSSNPGGSTTPSEAGGPTSSGSPGSGGSNLNWTPELIPPPPNPPDPPEILVRLKCGCKYAVECKCPPHMWNMTDVMNRIMASKYVVDSAGKKYEVADYSWFGSHGASAPCHEKKQIGAVRISFWIGLSLVQRMFSVFVEFGPCMPTGGLGKKDKKKEAKKAPPGMPKPGPNDPQPKPVLPVLSISVAPDEGWDDARPAADGDELTSSADMAGVSPFNDPLLAGLIAQRRDWSSVLLRGDVFLSSIVTLAELAPRRERSHVRDVYDLQPERSRRFDVEWTRDPAKSWPTYDPSRTPGGRP